MRVYTCEIQGRIAIVTIDRQFEDKYPVSELPLLAWFGVYCNLPPDGACWAEEEAKALEHVEDQLIELLGEFGSGWAVYAFSIATPGIREYYFYHSDKADVKNAFEILKSRAPNYRIEFDVHEDPTWEQYRRYISFKEKKPNLLKRIARFFFPEKS